MITFYSTNCPKCKILKQKLEQKNIEFETVEDVDAVVEYGNSHNIKSAPLLDVDGTAYDFKGALDYIKTI